MNINYNQLAIKVEIVVRCLLFMLLIAILPFAISSCNSNGSTSVSPSTIATKMLVVNASPDILPITFTIGGGTPVGGFFNYPFASNYYTVGSGYQNLQIRNTKNITIINLNDTLAVNTSYSLFVVGLNSATVKADSVTSLLFADTSSIPGIGSGKIRFINASPRTPGLDVTANGTMAFSAIPYKSASKYQQLPAGIYDFKIYATGSTSQLVDVPLITIQDGRLYTLFTHGLTGRTDTAAIGAAVIINK